MSTILKALRRLEGDKQRKAEAERLHTDVAASEPPPSRFALGRPRLVAVWLGLFFVVGAGVWLRGPDRETPPAATVPEVPAAPAPLPAAQSVPAAPVALTSAPARPDLEARPAPESAAEPTALASAQEPGEPEAATSERKGMPSSIREALRRRSSAAVGVPPPPEYVLPPAPAPKPPAAEPALVAAEPAPVPPAPVSPAPLPEPPGLRGVRVVRTVWHPLPGKRIAYLFADGSPTELREGEAWRELRVAEIKLSSVIFASGDRTVVRKVGETP